MKKENTIESSWQVSYAHAKDFYRYKEERINKHGGYNEPMHREHLLRKLGSGLLKFATLEDLIRKLSTKRKESEEKTENHE